MKKDAQADPGIVIVAESRAMRDVLDRAVRVAPTEANLLLSGESGTGKDLLARWIHEHSLRASGAYVKIDCGTLPENLLEAELFGYERGAFTGASATKPGRFEAAQGGTLVLDEVTGLSQQAQAKLLRVIEDRRFTRLGGTQLLSLNTRLISLTNINLLETVSRRAFRADLFHRLNVIPLELPSLRERREDILPLTKYFLELVARRHGRPLCTLTPESQAALKGYAFPGNVRELFHLIERAVLLTRSEVLGLEVFPPQITSAVSIIRSREQQPTLAQLEALYIREVLRSTRGQKSRAAEILGISRKNLYEKMRAYDIPYNQKRSMKHEELRMKNEE
ncbi:MAG TPA: sigma-54 dependent transcriptional regulator [Acidobacteriota bacterium]|nr:sigma-54 dependent transcriptional regulator [Acidobacteriota bacterium]